MKRKMVTIFLGMFVTLSLSAVDLLAQGRGRGGGGGSHMGAPQRAVFNNPAPVAVRPNPAPVARPVAPRSTFSGHPTPPFVTAPGTLGTRILPTQFNQGFDRRGFFSRPFGGFYSTYYPYSPYIWPMTLYPGPYVEPYLAPYSAPYTPEPDINQSEIDLANQVQRLTQEIDQLRQEQALNVERLTAPPPAPPSPPEPAIPTTLVFRDGREMTIQNYAIVGQTLWVLDEGTSTRIPISDLDVNATQAANRGRGTRLRLPER